MNYLLQPVIGASGVRTATVANVAGDDDAGTDTRSRCAGDWPTSASDD
jgi:hypothetical protein